MLNKILKHANVSLSFVYNVLNIYTYIIHVFDLSSFVFIWMVCLLPNKTIDVIVDSVFKN